ncbi:MAG TPA: hypothetical protein VIB98_04900, partial [Gemmatimonadaceae bacterium]
MRTSRTLVAFAIVAALVSACRARPAATPADSGFAAMQSRGHMAMGVDQYTSTHTFDALQDGGRITLVRDPSDSVGVAQIRAHLRLIQHAFQAGDFSTPAFVHMKTMPGTDVMASRRAVITYAYTDVPGGGEVRITSRDSTALAAIHAFMGAQR